MLLAGNRVPKVCERFDPSQTYQETPYGGVEDNVYYLRCGNVKLNIQVLFWARRIRTLCAFVPWDLEF